MAEEKMYHEALDAIRRGQQARARDLITRLLRTNSSRVDYWLWMSTLVDTVAERIYCLESAIRLDPENEFARRGLILLGARTASQDVRPIPPIRRHWEKELGKELHPQKKFIRRIWDNPSLRILLFLAAIGIMVGIIIGTVHTIQNQADNITFYRVSPFPTRTQAETYTPTASRTLVVRSPSPTFIGPTPLWMFLRQTYTPRPPYIDTPHPRIEAYRIAMNAYERNQIDLMLQYMQQAATFSPGQPDLIYYIGEAYRLKGDFEKALEAYQEAITTNPSFAPPYLGLAILRLEQNPDINVTDNLQKAIQLDPKYADAYLTRAAYWLYHGQPALALADLNSAEASIPGLPMTYVLTAQAHLELGDYSAALESAKLGYETDQTLLPAYITLAQCYLMNSNAEQALYYAEIYTRYESNDGLAWRIVGQGYFERGEGYYQLALEALNKAIDLDEEDASALRYRGNTYLALGDAKRAVNDLFAAATAAHYQFEYTIDLAMAFWADGRLEDASVHFSIAEDRAETDAQLAIVYYHRAQVYEQNEFLWDAKMDYEDLLALPDAAAPMEWRVFAENRLLTINPPTPTNTASRTSTPTSTATSTITPTITTTMTATLSPTATRIPTSTRTPDAIELP